MTDTPSAPPEPPCDERTTRQTALGWVGPDCARHLAAAARKMHANRSLHQHEVGADAEDDGACRYCWYDAAMAIKGLRSVGLLSAPPAPDAKPVAHTVRVFTAEHPLQDAPTTAYTVEHPPQCKTLPVGAICWFDHHPERHRIPGEVGDYWVTIAQEYVGPTEDSDPSDIEEHLSFEKYDPATEQFLPWDFPPEPPHAWAAWGHSDQLLAFILHPEDGSSVWAALGLPEDDPAVMTMEALDRASYEVLASIVGFDNDPAAQGAALRRRFCQHRQHALPLLSLAALRSIDPAHGARMTAPELYEVLTKTADTIAGNDCYTGSLSWVMLPGEKKYGVQALLNHRDHTTTFIANQAALQAFLDDGEADDEH